VAGLGVQQSLLDARLDPLRTRRRLKKRRATFHVASATLML